MKTNVMKVTLKETRIVDLLIGGSPCQGFSYAGKQLNFLDPRSKLFFDYVKAKDTLNPKYFLLENVKMKKEYQDVISKYLGVEPIEINSALLSAQNRVRLYWTNIPNITQPIDKGVIWGDVREHGVESESYYYTPQALEWLYKHGYRKHKILKVHEDNEKMQMLEASHYKKYSSQRFFGILDTGIDNSKQKQEIGAMRGRYIENGVRKDYGGKTKQYIEFRNDGKSNCLTTVLKDNIVVPFQHFERVLADNFAYRYITPLECERLQTLPDGYTEGVSNTQRYKMLGNGWTVDVIAHILSYIPEIHLQTVVSLFDGISCGQVALERANKVYNQYYASEIDKYAIKVTQKNYPHTMQLGDVTKIDWEAFGDRLNMIKNVS